MGTDENLILFAMVLSSFIELYSSKIRSLLITTYSKFVNCMKNQTNWNGEPHIGYAEKLVLKTRYEFE